MHPGFHARRRVHRTAEATAGFVCSRAPLLPVTHPEVALGTDRQTHGRLTQPAHLKGHHQLSDSKGYRWCRRPKQRKSQHPIRPVPSLHPKRKHDPIPVSQPPSPPKSANPNPKSSSLVFLSRTLNEYPIRRRKCLLPSNKLVSIVPVHGCHRSPRQPPATQVRDYLGVPASEDPFGTSLNE